MLTVYSPSTEDAMRRVFHSLSERDRRLYAAAEALKLERGGLLYLTRLFGCDPKTIHQGQRDLDNLPDVPPERSRKKGVDANG